MTYYRLLLLSFLVLQGCAAVNTFPTIARAGDTVSLMVGDSENARKQSVSVSLIDSSNTSWDLQSLGLVRSVFSVRPDGRSEGLHHSTLLELGTPWAFGHEPLQTVLVIDVPSGVSPGIATVNISTNTTDNSSGVGEPFSVNLEIVPGAGSSDNFLFKHAILGDTAMDFSRVEPLPHAKISFGLGEELAAVSLEIGFDELVVNADDLTLYVPQATIRDSITNTFDKTQRMVYWRQNGSQLFIDILAPQGIDPMYLNFYVLHPRGLSTSPGFSLLSSTVYNTDGNALNVTPELEYFP